MDQRRGRGGGRVGVGNVCSRQLSRCCLPPRRQNSHGGVWLGVAVVELYVCVRVLDGPLASRRLSPSLLHESDQKMHTLVSG